MEKWLIRILSLIALIHVSIKFLPRYISLWRLQAEIWWLNFKFYCKHKVWPKDVWGDGKN